MNGMRLNTCMSRCLFLLLIALAIVEQNLANEHRQWLRTAEELPANQAYDQVEIEPVDPEDEQGIRGGMPIETPVDWFVTFLDTTLCGGALVHEDVVVTTAHCVNGANYPNRVRVGSLFRNTGGTVQTVQGGRIHPRWNGIIEEGYDIALLKLTNPVNNSYSLATMNSLGNVPGNQERLFVYGHGIQQNDGPISNRLRGLLYKYIQDCEPRLPPGVYNPTWFLCADANRQRGTCAGDSGGPIVINGTSLIVGLNSFSPGDCESQRIDVYTRISTYYDWIIREICFIADNPPATGCPAACFFSPSAPSFLSEGFQAMRSFFGF